jgi:hypothetical protein
MDNGKFPNLPFAILDLVVVRLRFQSEKVFLVSSCSLREEEGIM